MTPPMTNSPEASIKRLELISAGDPAGLVGSLKEDVAVVLSLHRAQAALLEEYAKSTERLVKAQGDALDVGAAVGRDIARRDLETQLSALQSDNDTLRAALEEIAHHRENVSQVHNWSTWCAGRASEALSTTRGRP
jgi:hypothetical protein